MGRSIFWKCNAPRSANHNLLRIRDRFAASICDGLPHLLARRDDLPAAGPDLHLDYGLFLLAGILTDHGSTLTDYGLPAHQHALARTEGNPLLAADLRYKPTEELRLWDEMYAQLNPDQWSYFDTIVAAIGAVRYMNQNRL